MKAIFRVQTPFKRLIQPCFRSPVYIHRLSFSSQAETASYTLEQIKELRSRSGAPIKECQKALQSIEHGDDRMNDALDWLRIRGQAVAKQKSGDAAQYGFIGLFKQNTNASLIEVNSVTDFVENNTTFQDAVLNIGNTVMHNSDVIPNHILNTDELSDLPVIQLETNQPTEQSINEALTDIMGSIRENLVFRRAYRMQCTPSGVICGYLHGRKTANLGLKGSLVSLETDLNEICDEIRGALNDLGQDIATHIVANYPQPKYIMREDMTNEQIEREKQVILQTIMEKDGEGKDLEIVQKQIDGKMKKFFMENVLMEQPFCLEDDNKLTVQKLVQDKAKELNCDIKVANMIVYNLGES